MYERSTPPVRVPSAVSVNADVTGRGRARPCCLGAAPAVACGGVHDDHHALNTPCLTTCNSLQLEALRKSHEEEVGLEVLPVLGLARKRWGSKCCLC